MADRSWAATTGTWWQVQGLRPRPPWSLQRACGPWARATGSGSPRDAEAMSAQHQLAAQTPNAGPSGVWLRPSVISVQTPFGAAAAGVPPVPASSSQQGAPAAMGKGPDDALVSNQLPSAPKAGWRLSNVSVQPAKAPPRPSCAPAARRRVAIVEDPVPAAPELATSLAMPGTGTPEQGPDDPQPNDVAAPAKRHRSMALHMVVLPSAVAALAPATQQVVRQQTLQVEQLMARQQQEDQLPPAQKEQLEQRVRLSRQVLQSMLRHARAQQESAQWQYLIEDMYRRHNPGMLLELPRIYAKYKGHEDKLFQALCNK